MQKEGAVMKRSFSVKLLCLLFAFFLAMPSNPCAADSEEKAAGTHVVILATSDMHGNVWGCSYEDNAESNNSGMARLYSYIRQDRGRIAAG